MACIAKNRFGLPTEIVLSWASFVEYLNNKNDSGNCLAFSTCYSTHHYGIIRPQRAEKDHDGYGFLAMFDRGEVTTISDLSRKVHMDDHLILKAIRLATVSTTIQRAIIYGQEPTGLSIAKIRAIKTENWPEQERILGFV